MFVSLSHRFLFVHVPKTAGSSLKLALRPYGVEQPASITDDPALRDFVAARAPALVARGMVFPNHIGVAEIGRRTRLDLGGLLKFAIVRDPWRRLRSLHRHYRRDPRHPYHARVARLDFDGFVRFLVARRERGLHADAHPQLDYLLAAPGRLGVDRLLRHERLHEALALLCTELGLTLALPTANRAPASDDDDDSGDEQTRALVAEFERGLLEVVPYRDHQPDDLLPALYRVG